MMDIVRRNGAGGQPSQQRTDTFTGLVYADALLSSTDGTAVNSVFFAPGARTFWHSHERGQVLHVLSGRGLIASAGERAQPLDQGDIVWVPAGEAHWHGGGADTVLVHLAVSLGQTTWLRPVSADEYGGSA
jgi:quercetin dioxygenase-like cupin family protein